MSLRINNKAYNIIALSAILLFLLSVSTWHLSKNYFQSSTRCNLAYQTAFNVKESKRHHNTTQSNPNSSIPNKYQQLNHCPTCSSLVTNYFFSFDYAIKSKQYRPITFVPVYKESIPELKPPKLA